MTYQHIQLTIAIPTYNRSGFLDRCLESIFDNISGYESCVEILIANNASTDNTNDVIDKYKMLGFNFRYHVHEQNTGLEGNLLYCFNNSNGKYLWIFSDDDFLLPGAFKEIYQYVQGDYGLIHVGNYWYNNDIHSEKPDIPTVDATIYYDANDFLRKVSFYLTFVTANIVNKNYFNRSIDLEAYNGTYLVLVAWELSIAMSAPKNVYINNLYIAALAGNSGGYHVYEVFSKHMNKVMLDFKDRGLMSGTVKSIKHDLMTRFFPGLITLSKQNKMSNFKTNNAFLILFEQYKYSPTFWCLLMPRLLLPVKFFELMAKAKKYLRSGRPVNARC